MAENIFADEWRECLQAQYLHVVRIEDRVTLPSLTIVMHQAGFSDTELAELRVRATMHVDHVDADFVPDLDILEQPETTEESPIVAVPEVPAAIVEAVLVDTEDESEAEDVIDEVVADLPEDDPDAPQQLSLF